MTLWISKIYEKVCGLSAAGCGLLFPPSCVCCRADLPQAGWDIPLCRACTTRLVPENWRGCQRCAGIAPETLGRPERCPLCRNVSLKFDSAVALGDYHAGLRDVVLRMKRPTHDALSAAMGRLLADRRREQLLAVPCDMAIPIPLFWTCRLGRGGNSPDVLAQCLAKSLHIPVRRDILVKHRNTLRQADLPPSQRFQNVRDAFRIRRPRAVDGARILLVDDVLTTGATCSEAAKMLKKAGAAWVGVAVVARAQGK